MPIRQPWDSCGLGWYSPSEPGSAVRNPDSSTGSGNEPCRCANCYQWDARILSNFCGLREMSAPQDRSPSLDLRFREKRLAGQPAPRRRAQALKSPPNRALHEFSLRAGISSAAEMGAVSSCLLRAAASPARPKAFWCHYSPVFLNSNHRIFPIHPRLEMSSNHARNNPHLAGEQDAHNHPSRKNSRYPNPNVEAPPSTGRWSTL